MPFPSSSLANGVLAPNSTADRIASDMPGATKSRRPVTHFPVRTASPAS